LDQRGLDADTGALAWLGVDVDGAAQHVDAFPDVEEAKGLVFRLERKEAVRVKSNAVVPDGDFEVAADLF